MDRVIMCNEQPVEVLLVEDNSGDLFLTKKAFSKARITNNIQVATDGEIAMNILCQEGQYKDAHRPDIILLDINLLKKNGQEILADIKSDDNLKTIPVIMLSSSEAQDDIIQSYKHHANGYISKPVAFEEFAEVVSSIEDFWFNTVKLPKV